jgi:predicted phosphohydrolase
MSLFAIGDLHLSLTSEKPMDVFGGRWQDYTQKIQNGFADVVSGDDVTVICGDITWGMDLEEALADFKFIDALPGKKIILKGNHDYWFTTASKAKKFFAENGIETIDILHNNFFPYGEAAICGTRGWFYEEERGDEHDKKILARECLRLEASLKAAGEREKYVFLHYPPKYQGYECPEILALLKEYGAKTCIYGHIHSRGCAAAFNGMLDGTLFRLVSADYVDFVPVKIL